MIHQFIFAGPKPGLSAEAFKSYWINFHAIDYAAKIPQIRQYLVAERLDVPCEPNLPFFEGVAEIWLANEAEQIASLQTPEFLEGARRDEPRWAAFWQTLVLDTDSQVVRETADPQQPFVKLYTLLKRRPDLSIEHFREQLLTRRGAAAMDGIERHLVALARLGLYGLGEPRFDAIEVRSFRSREALAALLDMKGFVEAVRAPAHADPRYVFNFVGQENWIIRPGARAHDARRSPQQESSQMTAARDFFDEHMRYVAAQDIATMVNDTYTDDAILYHNFPYFPGDPPYIHRGKAEIIKAQQTIFLPQNHGAITPAGDVFNFMEAEGAPDSLFFQILIRSPTKGLFLNTDFWILERGKMKHQFVTGYRLQPPA